MYTKEEILDQMTYEIEDMAEEEGFDLTNSESLEIANLIINKTESEINCLFDMDPAISLIHLNDDDYDWADFYNQLIAVIQWYKKGLLVKTHLQEIVYKKKLSPGSWEEVQHLTVGNHTKIARFRQVLTKSSPSMEGYDEKYPFCLKYIIVEGTTKEYDSFFEQISTLIEPFTQDQKLKDQTIWFKNLYDAMEFAEKYLKTIKKMALTSC